MANVSHCKYLCLGLDEFVYNLYVLVVMYLHEMINKCLGNFSSDCVRRPWALFCMSIDKLQQSKY